VAFHLQHLDDLHRCFVLFMCMPIIFFICIKTWTSCALCYSRQKIALQNKYVYNICFLYLDTKGIKLRVIYIVSIGYAKDFIWKKLDSSLLYSFLSLANKIGEKPCSSG
jgi:hypothetical protein